MLEISIEVRRNTLAGRFAGFVTGSRKAIMNSLRGAAERAVEIVSSPPEKFEGPYPWVSERQRMYVMIHIALGDIIVPRPRTGAFGRSWSIEEIEDGFRIRSDYAAGKYVAGGPDEQASIHAGRWTPLRTAVETALGELPNEIVEQITLEARRSGF